ncbi:hypothetical protein QTO30_14520 [Yoonia sp. GPGPB17]|uniref:hypothetical protein n=1 Tax=Yoonia sp. GPGPB17 TaxID=3026147 RepID=UPI0030C1D3F6
MLKHLLILLLLLVFQVVTPPAIANEADCINHVTLLDTPLEDLSDIPACDRIGASYLRSFGIRAETSMEGLRQQITEEFEYYLFLESTLRQT